MYKYKIDELVTVDTCHGRFDGKVKGYSQSMGGETLYKISGRDIITSSSERGINVQGPVTCSDKGCFHISQCKYYTKEQ